jgi:hypothetical protein
MAPMMRALARSEGHELTWFALKYFEASTAIVVGRKDVDIALLVNLRKFIEEECTASLCSTKRCATMTYNTLSHDGEGEF